MEVRVVVDSRKETSNDNSQKASSPAGEDEEATLNFSSPSRFIAGRRASPAEVKAQVCLASDFAMSKMNEGMLYSAKQMN